MTTRGYLEGYYGRLLEWHERTAMLDTLAELGLGAYAYAPKEDGRHRLHWREPYGAAWERAFRRFCDAARARGVAVVAGLAPGLDFDFGHLDGGADFESARVKLERLRECGATRSMLLMDDIDDDFARRAGDQRSEGEAHARLANRLGERLDVSLVVVPRVYAAELAADAPDYLADFARTLDARHALSVCGRDIVAREVDPEDCALPGERAVDRETILWDNLYANDYCPRRLFVGPWCGRHGVGDVLLNGTGLPATDRLLLALMADGLGPGPGSDTDDDTIERALSLLERHGVPRAFRRVASAFRHPTTNDRLDAPYPALEPTPDTLAALEELLWRWKTPLAREWYPFLMSLRHDLLIDADALPPDRVRKTQSPPLARRLLRPRSRAG